MQSVLLASKTGSDSSSALSAELLSNIHPELTLQADLGESLLYLQSRLVWVSIPASIVAYRRGIFAESSVSQRAYPTSCTQAWWHQTGLIATLFTVKSQELIL